MTNMICCVHGEEDRLVLVEERFQTSGSEISTLQAWDPTILCALVDRASDQAAYEDPVGVVVVECTRPSTTLFSVAEAKTIFNQTHKSLQGQGMIQLGRVLGRQEMVEDLEVWAERLPILLGDMVAEISYEKARWLEKLATHAAVYDGREMNAKSRMCKNSTHALGSADQGSSCGYQSEQLVGKYDCIYVSISHNIDPSGAIGTTGFFQRALLRSRLCNKINSTDDCCKMRAH